MPTSTCLSGALGDPAPHAAAHKEQAAPGNVHFAVYLAPLFRVHRYQDESCAQCLMV